MRDWPCAQVCDVLKAIIPEVGNLRAAQEHFREAQSNGKSLLVVVHKELGEGYVEQLARADPEMIVYAELVEEKK